MLKKFNYIRSNAITQSAKDEDCTLCGKNDGTTVFCHLDELWAGKGKGIKADDIAGFFGCATCHSNYGRGWEGGILDQQIMRAMYRTWKRLIEKGVIKIKDYEPWD